MDQLAQLRKSFETHKTKKIEWRKSQLRALDRLIDENKDELCLSLKQDLNKHEQETIGFELAIIKNAITHSLNTIDEYAEPKHVSTQIQMKLSYSAYVQHQPYGVVLIIGAWNYPLQLCLVPLVGAISAGNCALIKPSELSEHTALLISKLITKYMDTDCIHVFNGGAQETINLLKEKFDYIMYTGSTAIGKTIMEAAAKHMTPVILECGGKSPVYIDSTADMSVTAKRLVWGRFTNAGQTCIAPDYVLCTKETYDSLLPLLKQALDEFYTRNPKESNSYGRIINKRHFNRLKALIDKNKVVFGGELDEDSLYISPTLMENCSKDDLCMKEEIFGPILPFVFIQNQQEALSFINSNDKPLALYVFAKNDQLYRQFLNETSSGAYSYNDVLVHCALDCLPFGGVGASGLGAYHGDYSFETFSHKRAVLKTGFFGDSLLSFRYPPYSTSKTLQSVYGLKIFRKWNILRYAQPTAIILAIAMVATLYFKKYSI